MIYQCYINDQFVDYAVTTDIALAYEYLVKLAVAHGATSDDDTGELRLLISSDTYRLKRKS